MVDKAKSVRLTPEQKIAALEQEIADRRAKAQNKAANQAAAKKYELEQLEQRIAGLNDKAEEIEKWFEDHGISPLDVTAVAPAKPAKKETAPSAE